jgi:hypothetical protein
MQKVRLNKRQLSKTLKNPVQKKITPIVRAVASREVERGNRELLAKFMASAITQEISLGPDAENISGSLGGYGNLFSFLGFEADSNPVQEIADFLSDSIRVKSVRNGQDLSIVITVRFPTREDVKYLSQLPWINKGMVEAIERGISGFGQYLYSESGFEASRSETGIQVKTRVRPGLLLGQTYLSKMMQDVSRKVVANIRKSAAKV